MNDRFKKKLALEQDPKLRIKNFAEVTLGYDKAAAIKEASRCIQCKKPQCVNGCPARVAIPEFIKLITENDLPAAYKKIQEAHMFPSVCGRVCPQETQCEGNCILNKKNAAIEIGKLEKFVGDWAHAHENKKTAENKITPTQNIVKKIAVVGSGPASLVAASELAHAGFNVTIFEALHEIGGILMCGIPEFRLPKKIVKKEINKLEKLNIKIIKNFVVGKTATIDELLEKYAAVFIGTGAGLPILMSIPGENSLGVYSANEYLTRINLMKAYLPNARAPITKSKVVVTIGGGNVAMDAARTARRLGADRSIIIYRRSEEEIPARHEEIRHAKEEGIEFKLLCAPIEIFADNEGHVYNLKCIHMELGAPDESGRRQPTPIVNSEFTIECQIIIVAIGSRPNPLIQNTTPDIISTKYGTIEIDPNTGRTSKKFVYAGGDVVSGSATVILAMRAGKNAAKAIIEDLASIHDLS